MEEHTDQRYEALEETVKELFSRHMKEKDTLTDQEALNIIEETVFSDPSSGGLQESAELIRRLYQRMRCRTGILDPYIRDERINEIERMLLMQPLRVSHEGAGVSALLLGCRCRTEFLLHRLIIAAAVIQTIMLSGTIIRNFHFRAL